MTKQLELWRSHFGWEYASRNNNQVTPEDQRRLAKDWGRILSHAVTPSPKNVLEIGCSIGRNLLVLRNFISELHGIDPNPRAVSLASEMLSGSGVAVREGNAFELPFEDQSFDLVFTSGVLIHIAPDDLNRATDEIMRVAKHYIVCIEYFSHKPEQVPYQGMDGYLFKRDFGRFYLERYPGLKVRDYGFFWQPLDSSDNSNWWLFEKTK
jgi:pseudaminic acid biosynthesis-associated methylase